jgi:serine/threonine protein kinase
MTNSPELCPTCRQPKEPKASGRLTQWIVACNCGAPAFDPALEQGPTVSICAICKKRIEKGRPGSFTQWVFRVDICDCEKPEVISVPASSLGEAITGPELVEAEDDPEPLPLSPDKFPVDRYKPLKEIGGGMAGSVYLCRDLVLNKKVAVKTLRKLTAEQLVAFQQEAKASSRLSHPGIVQVLDFGATESGDPFMVMEYFNGISLDRYLEHHGALTPLAVTDIMLVLCGGLTVAHENGVYHRDLKPSNILVRDLGGNKFEARLIDFGLARMTGGDQETTLFQGTSLVGSPLYMSPDQAARRPYDARCEVYSLGCLMFELLTGRPPFTGETALNTLYMHVNEPPPKLSDVVDENFSDKLENVVARCLEKDPDKRFQTTAELAKALAPELAPDVTGIFMREKEKRKISVYLTLAVSIAAICGLFAMVTNSVLNPKKVPEKVAVAKFKSSQSEKKLEVQAKDDAEQLTHAMTGFASVGAEEDNFFGSKNSGAEVADMVKQKRHYKNMIFHEAGFTDKDIENLVALKPWTITMDDCSRITIKGFKLISTLKRCDRLVIDDATQLSTEALAELAKLDRLEFLSIRNAGLTDAHMKVLGDFPEALHKINVSGNPKITVAGLNYLKNRKRPMEVVAEGCAILLPAVTLRKLAAENNLSVSIKDEDTFSFNVFQEALNDTGWEECEDDFGKGSAPQKKID